MLNENDMNQIGRISFDDDNDDVQNDRYRMMITNYDENDGA